MFKSFITYFFIGIVFWVLVGYQRLHGSDYNYSAKAYACNFQGNTSWVRQRDIQSPSSISFSFNIGCGFLYFHGLKGNLSPAPAALFSNFSGSNMGQIKHFSYNKSPMYEANIAARILPWISGALTYYGQSNVSVESHYNSSVATGNINNPVWATFRSNLQLYGLLFKCYIQNPYALVMGEWTVTPYVAMGVGPAWQTWSNVCMYALTITNTGYSSTVLPLRQKVSANACWTGEAGLTFKPACPEFGLSLRVGCKFIDWGKSGSIGVLQQQGAKVGPFKPVSVNKVYSCVPFVGVQFNF